MWKLILLLLFAYSSAIAFINTNSSEIKGYEVIKAIPKTNEQIITLKNILQISDHDVWSYSEELGSPWVFLVNPSQVKKIKRYLTLSDIMYQQLNSTVAKEQHMLKSGNKLDIDKETIAPPRQTRNKRETPTNYGLSRRRYHSYAEMMHYMNVIGAKYPDKVKVLNIGTTFEHRSIQGVKIATEGRKTIAILIDAGIHAREWLGPATAMHIMAELAENPEYEYMLEKVAWYIFPSVNPDGYAHSRYRKALWRKTRRPGNICIGVDVNRNFDFHWDERGTTSDDECSDVYVGREPFSEAESTALAKFALEHQRELKLYISLHSYGTKILYPWAWTTARIANDEELHDLGEMVADAVKSVRGTEYNVGSVADLMYQAPGSSLDWMASIGIPLSYVIELPGYSYGFRPPPSYIRPTSDEMLVAMQMFHKYVEHKYKFAPPPEP